MRLKQYLTAFVIATNFILLSSIPALANNKDRTVTVMTQNMYPGTDFSEIFATTTFPELVTEVAEAYTDVQLSNVPERVAAVADQIQEHQPALVGLQEVALWQIGPFLDPAPATTVTHDYLQILMAELSARGLNYSPIVVKNNFEAEAPAVFSQTLAFDVHFTDRLVVLARTDLKVSEFKLEGTQSGHFVTRVSFTSPTLGTITIPRGWISVDVKMRGKNYRFINTHLESFSELAQYAQAGELLQGPANSANSLILAGDFNSDAEAMGLTYGLLIGSGLTDVWEITDPADPGFTWPLFLENPSVFTTPSQRLDLVFTRGKIAPADTDVVGEDPVTDVTPSLLRPSDHAGVVAELVLLP